MDSTILATLGSIVSVLLSVSSLFFTVFYYRRTSDLLEKANRLATDAEKLGLIETRRSEGSDLLQHLAVENPNALLMAAASEVESAVLTRAQTGEAITDIELLAVIASFREVRDRLAHSSEPRISPEVAIRLTRIADGIKTKLERRPNA